MFLYKIFVYSTKIRTVIASTYSKSGFSDMLNKCQLWFEKYDPDRSLQEFEICVILRSNSEKVINSYKKLIAGLGSKGLILYSIKALIEYSPVCLYIVYGEVYNFDVMIYTVRGLSFCIL